jgi:hypothetical protein
VYKRNTSRLFSMATSTDSIRRPLPLDVVDLTDQITLSNEGPKRGGGFADVHQGIWKSESFETKVLTVTIITALVVPTYNVRRSLSKYFVCLS